MVNRTNLPEPVPTHTPAPWQVLPIEPDVPYIRVRGILAGTRYKIANVPHCNFPGISEKLANLELEETIANANLIAAAPNLLKALEDLMSIELMVSQLTPKVVEHIVQARAAIAQAKGKLHI